MQTKFFNFKLESVLVSSRSVSGTRELSAKKGAKKLCVITDKSRVDLAFVSASEVKKLCSLSLFPFEVECSP